MEQKLLNFLPKMIFSYVAVTSTAGFFTFSVNYGLEIYKCKPPNNDKIMDNIVENSAFLVGSVMLTTFYGMFGFFTGPITMPIIIYKTFKK